MARHARRGKQEDTGEFTERADLRADTTEHTTPEGDGVRTVRRADDNAPGRHGNDAPL
jgi:hypothetical protein